MDESMKPKKAHADGGITKTGVRKGVYFSENEAEALRVKAFDWRVTESEIIREAVRRYLKLGEYSD